MHLLHMRMSRKNSNYDLLIKKLDQFTRKYYINQLIRGGLYTTGFLVLCFLVFALTEYFFYFGTGVRKMLFYSFIGLASASLIYWVAMPIIHYFRLGKIISHEQAAEIIGSHFGDVKDKLINVLQLNRQADSSSSRELIIASIEQKTEEIAPVPFQSAIDFKKNRRYLPYALPPLLILLGILIGAPSLIKEPTNRIIRNNLEFEPEAPFAFNLAMSELEVPQYEDFTLTVDILGDFLPEQAFVDVGGFQYRMKKESNDSYSYVFNNVQEDQTFYLTAEGVTSKAYTLKVLKKPNILDFRVDLDYPAYLGRTDESLANVGDLVIPQGTKIDWIIQSVNTDDLTIKIAEEELLDANRLSNDTYTFNKRVFKNSPYKLIVGNDLLPKADSVSYVISVIPDLYPTISLKQFQDSTNQKLLYLVGDASDDYGLKRITFNYQITNNGVSKGDLVTVEVDNPTSKQAAFDRIFDIQELQLSPGDEVSYYFEAWDNDGINGSKSSRSSLLKFAQPTKKEFQEKEDANEEEIKKALDRSKKEAQDIKQDFKALREKMLQEKSIDWQMKKELEDLLQRQEALENELDEAKNKFEENLKNQQEFAEIPEETREKQEKLQELFEELADEETKELMQKIQELLEELKKDQALEMMENMEMNEEELEMELERLKELFKQLEFERDMKQEIDNLMELAEEQQELAEETEAQSNEEEQEGEQQEGEQQEGEQQEGEQQEGEQQEGEQQEGEQQEGEQQEDEQQEGEQQENSESLEEQQEDINKAFEDIKEALEKLQEQNEQLQQQKDMENSEQQMEDIQQDLNQSIEQLQQQQNKKASKSQQNASQKMQQMAQQMQQQMQEGEMEQMQEDMAAMRQLLENLISLSFEQEALIETFNRTHTSTPKYTDLVQQQHKLEDDFHLIEDSLQALSQRVYQIESFVLEKVSDIKSHMGKSLKLLEDRKKAQASDNQQRTMKNVNDLALMFSESMDQMQQQMAAMMSGSQMCTKPGSSNPQDGQGNVPLDKISEGQQQLNGDMQKMKEGLKNGMSEGTSKEFAQMAAKQAALRKALRDIQKAKQSQGQGSKELEEILQQMDNIETDLVNKRLTNEMLKRQQDILTRLLESERAEREREYENKRESNTAEETEPTLPPSVEEYIKQREAQIEPFKTVSPALKPYYKELVEEYYKSLKEN